MRSAGSVRDRARGAVVCYIHKMLTAITRKVSSALANCELSFIARKPIDMEKARAQHHAYEELLGKLGAHVISLPEEPELPDSMFVEDPAVVLDEVAVICSLGTESRRKEAVTIAAALEKFRKLAYVKLPGTLEGGDVLRVGRKVFVGFTARSNPEGIRQFSVILEHFGYDLTAVPVTGCLHLKSAVTISGGTRCWRIAGGSIGKGWKGSNGWILNPANRMPGMPWRLADSVIFPASFPKTRAIIEGRGFHVLPLDISELQKAESGLTCSSLLFEA